MRFPDRLAALTVLGVVLAGCAQQVLTKRTALKGGVGTEEGQQAIEVVGRDTDGKPMKLSDYRGKVVVLDFWSVG